MSLKCHFNSCQWCGTEKDVFDHMETIHRNFLREPKGKLYFDFSFNDLQQEAFILCSKNGLYWFRQKLHQQRDDGIDFGVFHVGETEQVQYNLKLGLKRDGDCKYWGTFSSQPDSMQLTGTEDGYNLKFDLKFLEIANVTMPSRRLRLYFGEYNDSDDKLCPTPEDIEWLEEDERLNNLAIKKFTCGICREYIRRDARFCEHQHLICLQCFDKLLEHKKFRCPYCRGQYLHDCANDDLECLLRIIKWPNTSVQEIDKKLMRTDKKCKRFIEISFVKHFLSFEKQKI